jgi:hypothetical protein
MSLRSSRVASPWATGVTVYAAAMLIIAGGCQFFLGLAGVVNDAVFAKPGGYFFRFDNTVWGSIHLPSQPFWAIVLIAIDVLVIWALASTGQAAAARS